MSANRDNNPRIRDPIHDLIPFNTEDRNSVDRVCWDILQTKPFQRLRRVKQLGFSEFVYPGATHTRFSHSIGVFHTARQIRSLIDDVLGERRSTTAGTAAIVAALIHDLGHGPFSHAFEEAMNEIGFDKSHELWTREIIRSEYIAPHLEKFDPQFLREVEGIFSDKVKNIYGAIVSSQFDADRLDYMRRDRLMTGTQHGALDLSWILANLNVRAINVGIDDAQPVKQQALVIGPKAIPAVEGYILGLFQLYQTVYLHKTTRGLEKLFSAFLVRVKNLLNDGKSSDSGLPPHHPLLRFLGDPSNLDSYLRLDDFLIWGALSLAREAKDAICSELAARLLDRDIYRPLDISGPIAAAVRQKFRGTNLEEAIALKDRKIAEFKEMAAQVQFESKSDGLPILLQDVADRNPYKRRRDTKSGLDTIWVSDSDVDVRDLSELSDVVRALRPFSEYRVYARDESLRERLKRQLSTTLLEISQC